MKVKYYINCNITCTDTKLMTSFTTINLEYYTLYVFKYISYEIIFESMQNVNGAVSHSYAMFCFTLIICISLKLVQSFEETYH